VVVAEWLNDRRDMTAGRSGAAGYKYMRGEALERLRRRATRKWISALGRGVNGAGDDWTRGRRLLSTARDTRD
jgi:hypothetical protein